jgi:hypothetical protein
LVSEDHAARRPAQSELEAEILRCQANAGPLADVLATYLSSPATTDKVASSHAAARAWYAVNGDIERGHTAGLFVRVPKRAGGLPVLIVYVDSKARATDFSANREIYLARLSRAGLEFEELEFRLSKRPVSLRPGTVHTALSEPAPEPPPLDPRDDEKIELLCASLPESLRKSVSRAMSASYRLERARQSGNDE